MKTEIFYDTIQIDKNKTSELKTNDWKQVRASVICDIVRGEGMSEEHNRHRVMFSLGDMIFEYDEDKNQKNIKKHGLPLSVGARVFFDDYRIELDDTDHSDYEQRFDVIGSIAVASFKEEMVNYSANEEILFVVYTERGTITQEGKKIDVTRLISVRFANNFERGVYYANRR